ncbi:amidase domain-containing protein [Mycolicibacter minnesotensis]
MTVPTLSQIEGASWDYLTTSAAAWTSLADTWEATFTQVRDTARNPDDTPWTGAGAHAFQERTAADVVRVTGPADMLRRAAGIATAGAQAQEGNKESVIEAVNDAERDHFRVTEDYRVIETYDYYTSEAEQITREQAQQRHAEFITSRVSNLINKENEISNNLTTATDGIQALTFPEDGTDGQHPHVALMNGEGPPPILPGRPLSPSRQAAVDYAEQWAEGFNPDYESLGGGALDCTNFVSQTMRAGGFGDVGNGIDDWYHGDSDDWYYQHGRAAFPGNRWSTTWTLARENHNFVTQHSGRGEIVGVVPTPSKKTGLDPLAPSRAGLLPGDLIYYKDADGQINHAAVYVGQSMIDGVLTDVIDQHSAGNQKHDDWMPDSSEYTHAPAQVEFVHLKYPGE